MLLFGIGHKARNGKDTLGTFLSEHHGFHVIHFADALKEEALQAGWNPDCKNEFATTVIGRIYAKIKRNGDPRALNPIERDIAIFCNNRKIDYREIPTSTTFLQWIGTEFRRAQDPQYWVKRAWERICEAFMKALIERANPESLNQVEQLGMDIRRGTHVQSLMLGVDWFKVCVCDMRFVNELVAIKEWGGYTFDVRRVIQSTVDKNLWFPYTDPDRDPNHPSEIELDAVPHDFTIRSGSVPGIHSQANNIMKLIAQGGAKWLK